jgi:cytidylate kinase
MTDGRAPIVTLSATFGAGGSRIGPLLAEALGVPFVDRAITVALAGRLELSEEAVAAREEAGPSRFDQLIASLAAVGGMAGADMPIVTHGDRGFVEETERVVRTACRGEGAVVLGRAGAVVLADQPGALHVRLDGPIERRIAHAMEVDGTDRETAEEHARTSDAARERYVRSFYGRDAADPSLYHLVIDSTRIPHDVCVRLIADAARARAALD